MTDSRLASKLWLETDDGYVFGPGIYNLLKRIKKTGTLKQASQELDMSYRYSWGLIKKAEEKLGQNLIEATKGGRQGGGSTMITQLGESYIHDFEEIQEKWRTFVSSHLNSIMIEAKILEADDIEIILDLGRVILSGKDYKMKEGDVVKVRVTL